MLPARSRAPGAGSMTTMRLAGGLPRLLLALAGLIAAAAAPAVGRTAPADTAHCVDSATLDLRRILPPPPSAGSPRERAELDELLRIQAERTSSEADLARRDVARTVALFRHLSVDETAVLLPAKRAFARPRPFTVEPRLAPVTERPASGSYPSGHSLWAYTTALVLADMVPERRAQLLARADEYAHNRNVAGVHYPSDVEAGKLAGTALAALLFACPAFEREEAAARKELRDALGLR